MLMVPYKSKVPCYEITIEFTATKQAGLNNNTMYEKRECFLMCEEVNDNNRWKWSKVNGMNIEHIYSFGVYPHI